MKLEKNAVTRKQSIIKKKGARRQFNEYTKESVKEY